MATQPRHIIKTRAGKWRFTCPEGHTDWRLWNGVFCCETCRRQLDAGEKRDGVYEFLRDQKTGQTVRRDDLEIRV